MPSSRPPAARAPAHAQTGDDLTQISGIGPVSARRLGRAGIRTFADLARRTPEELATILAGVAGTSAGRIVASDWSGQARRLETELAVSSNLPERSLSFGLEFRLAADDAVRQTAVHDNQTGADATWPGWNVDRLMGFLHANVPSPREPEARTTHGTDSRPLVRVAHLASARPRSGGAAATTDEPTAVGLQLVPDPLVAATPTLDYSAAIAARKLDGGGEFSIVDLHGTVRVDQGVALAGAGPPLASGLYRLVAMVEAYATGHAPADRPLWSQAVSGGLVQVTAPRSETAEDDGDRVATEQLLAEGAITESEATALRATPTAAL